ncbi:MAG: hypothetical protein HYT62_04220 [Candidatus Yanofskybacteria bacterium]|nr:hypothetical protein [Candidatus Yanofskybacteria bacterium]
MSIESKTEQVVKEKRDRFDEFMRTRHEGAIAGLKVEEALSYIDSSVKQDDYPKLMSPENITIRKKAEEIIEELFQDRYPLKKEEVRTAIERYLFAKVRADRFQIELGNQLDERGIRKSGPEAGGYLFKEETGREPVGRINLYKEGGYIKLTFYDRRDYFDFRGIEEDESGGCFYQSLYFPGLGEVAFILEPWSSENYQSDTNQHERQHFINNSLLSKFEGLEGVTFTDAQKAYPKEYPILSEAIRRADSRVDIFMQSVKDELLACVKDGRSLSGVTKFWDLNLYDFLREGSTLEEQQEVGSLLGKIKEELEKGSGLFEGGKQARGLLVYHLIDIPFMRFPERVAAVIKFYKKRMDRVLKHLPEALKKDITKWPEKDRLEELSRDMIGELIQLTFMLLDWLEIILMNKMMSLLKLKTNCAN